MSMLARTMLVLCVVASTAPSVSRADQHAAELPALFSRLGDAEGGAHAPEIEQKIWSLWFAAPAPRAKQLFESARQATQHGALDEALATFSTLIKEFPDFAEAWNQRAIVRFLQNDISGALADVERTLALEPHHFGALTGRGQCYLRMEKPREALVAFEAALRVHPRLDGVARQIEMLRAYVGPQQAPI